LRDLLCEDAARKQEAEIGRVKPNDPEQHQSAWMRSLSWLARRRPATWFLVNVGGKIDPVLMRISGGRLKSTLNAPTIVLTHTGAKSGTRRQNPLAYFTVGEEVVLIASKGGAPGHPAWYRNLVANPEVELWTGGDNGGRYRARTAEGEERERLWRLATTMYPGFAGYQDRATNRQIPVVVCSPVD
jgi:deazaflavin-dependent oxidoreductase (nitroreductase family)